MGLWKLLLPVLEWIYSFTQDYAITIILITLLIKLVLIPLDIKSKKSTAKMAKLKPQLDAINEKYKNDKEKASQKTMELYKKEKISPFSGCLPALLMMIPLFALYALLRNVAGMEIRKIYDFIAANDVEGLKAMMETTKFLWVQNIWQADTFFGANASILPSVYKSVSVYKQQFSDITQEAFDALIINREGISAAMNTLLDSYIGPASRTNGLFVLPLLAGGTQFLYTLLTPGMNNSNFASQGDAPDQTATFSKVMRYGFPLMSVWICATASASFALYWTASNIFMIVTQFILNRVLDKGDETK